MAHKNKPPAFQFYVNDWASSLQVRAMTPAQRVCYIDLLAASWPDGIPAGIPLWTLTGCRTQEEFDSLKDLVLAQFKAQDGVFVHPKLAEQWKQLKKYHKAQQDKAKKGANARWHGSGKDQGMPEDASSSSSSTATASCSANPTVAAAAVVPPQETETERQLAAETIIKRLNLHDPEKISSIHWALTISDYWPTQTITVRSLKPILEQYRKYKAKKLQPAEPRILSVTQHENGKFILGDPENPEGVFPTEEKLYLYLAAHPEITLAKPATVEDAEIGLAASKAFEIVED